MVRKSGEVPAGDNTEKRPDKGKEKDDDGLRKSKLALSQALGRGWRTASAVVVSHRHERYMKQS